MFRAVLAAAFVGAASAFSSSLASGCVRNLAPARRTTSVRMQESVVPVNIFEGMDGEGQDMKTSSFLKESEVKHGRLAMLAAVGWPAAELLHPYIAETVGLPNLLNEAGQVPSVLNGGLEKIINIPGGIFLVLFALGRAFSIETGALRPRTNFLSANPKERFPHDLGFDPLGFYAKATPAQRVVMAQKELNNGRLAMIAISLYALIEFVSKTPIMQIAAEAE